MNEVDVVVIGGGAAGLSAALVLARARRNVLVIDAGSPRNAPAAHMHGFLSRDGFPPAELLTIARGEITGYGGKFVTGTVTEDCTRRYVRVLTLGLRWAADHRPPAPGGQRPPRRTPRHRRPRRPMGARRAALPVLPRLRSPRPPPRRSRLDPRGSEIHAHRSPMVQRRRHLRYARNLVDLGSRHSSRPGQSASPKDDVTRIVVENDQLIGVEVGGECVIARDAVFVPPRFVPNNHLLTALNCQVDDAGWVVADRTGRTSVVGVWVAGNVVNPRAQVITAAGEGSAAAIAINADLVEEDVHDAVRNLAPGTLVK